MQARIYYYKGHAIQRTNHRGIGGRFIYQIDGEPIDTFGKQSLTTIDKAKRYIDERNNRTYHIASPGFEQEADSWVASLTKYINSVIGKPCHIKVDIDIHNN